MSLPYMPGWWDEIKDSVPGIMNGVNTLINPHYQNDEALKQAIAKDPTVLQKLRDLEANSPGLLARTYGGKNVNNIMGLNESPESSQGRLLNTKRNELLQNPDNVAAVAGQDITQAKNAQAQLEANQSDARVKKATEQPQIDTAGYQADLLRLERDKKLDDNTKNMLYTKVRDTYNKSGRDAFSELMSGKLSQGEQEALLNDEGTWRGIQARMQKYQEDQQNNRTAMGIRISTYSNVLPTARQIWSQAKTGDVMSYVRLLSDPKAMQRVQAIKDGKAKPESEDDKRLVAAFDGFGKIETDQQEALTRQALKDVMTSLVTMDSKKEFSKMEPGQRLLKIQTVNQQLGVLNQLTGKNLQVRFIEGGFFSSPKLELVDGKTQQVTPIDKITDKTFDKDPFAEEASRLLAINNGNLTEARKTVTNDKRLTTDQRNNLLAELDRQYNTRRFKE